MRKKRLLLAQRMRKKRLLLAQSMCFPSSARLLHAACSAQGGRGWAPRSAAGKASCWVLCARAEALRCLLAEMPRRDGSRGIPSFFLVEMLCGDACGGACRLPLHCLLASCLAAAS